MYDKLEGVKGPCLQGWWVSRVRIACALWMIGEGFTEKKPVFNIPCLFGSKYVRRFGSRVHVNVKQDEADHYSSFLVHMGQSSPFMLLPQVRQTQILQREQYQFAPVIRSPHSEHGLVRHSSAIFS